MPSFGARIVAAALTVAVLTAGCAADDDEVPTAVPGPPTTTTTTTTPPPRETTPTPTSMIAPPAPPPLRVVFLSEGSTGGPVWDLEASLAALGYWPGVVDAVYDDETAHAVTALQKVAGIERTGRVDLATEWALRGALVPALRATVGRVIEIDKALQVMTVATDGRIDAVFDVSTGRRPGWTPPGAFSITRHIDGYRRSRLGVLYRPKYFNQGIAIHGYPSVPTYAASHGCIRVTNRAMDHIWATGLAEIGTPVGVY